ncbi:MAG: hypothetical protein JO318_08690 [Chloroflexi bacterium]|nr:hypothetical protein [Chloroflexota bacterium]
MSRRVLVATAAVLTVVDAAIHLRRSLVPTPNPFESPLHEQFLLYSVVAIVLVILLIGAPRWLGGRTWLASLALIVWLLGAIGVWLIAYHAPNPPGVLPDEGYVSKVIELLVILVLLATLREPAPASPPGQFRGAPEMH